MLLRQQILFSTASSHAKPKKNSRPTTTKAVDFVRHLPKTLNWLCLWTCRACASAVETLQFSAASWQFSENLQMFWTILWIFRGHSWKLTFEANFLSLEAAEDVQPSLNKFSTSQRVSDIPATPTGSPGKKFFICETFSLDASSTYLFFRKERVSGITYFMAKF